MKNNQRALSTPLSMLLAMLVGFYGIAAVKQNAEMPAPVNQPRPTLTPTYDMTPPGVEGDDGSLGGPVYDENSPVTPRYQFKETP